MTKEEICANCGKVHEGFVNRITGKVKLIQGCKKFKPQNHSPKENLKRLGSSSVLPEDKEPEESTISNEGKTSGSDDETLGDKWHRTHCKKCKDFHLFFWQKDIKEAVKKLKFNLLKKYKMTSIPITKEIDKIFGKELI